MAELRAEKDEAPDPAPPPAKRGGRRRLVLIAAPALLIAAAAGAWVAGLAPFAHGGAQARKPAPPGPPIYVDLPEMVANLDSDPRRPRYVKLHARIEVADRRDEAAVQAAMPRIQDLFQTYLRDMRPEDLRGSMGTYRLREELIARADVAAAPGRIEDVLFVEMIVQ